MVLTIESRSFNINLILTDKCPAMWPHPSSISEGSGSHGRHQSLWPRCLLLLVKLTVWCSSNVPHTTALWGYASLLCRAIFPALQGYSSFHCSWSDLSFFQWKEIHYFTMRRDIYIHATAHMLRPAEARGRPVGVSALFPLGESLGSNSGVSSEAGTFISWNILCGPKLLARRCGGGNARHVWRWEENFEESVVSVHLWVGSGAKLRWPGFPNKPSRPPFYEFESQPIILNKCSLPSYVHCGSCFVHSSSWSWISGFPLVPPFSVLIKSSIWPFDEL